MIYLDNSAGSYPKPPGVAQAMARALDCYGANPGRGNYLLTRCTAEMVEKARLQLAELINAPRPERVIFTAGATMSLNMALHGLLSGESGAPCHVVCTSMEHNSLLRPLNYLTEAGRVSFTQVRADSWGYVTAEQMAQALRPETRLIALIHASNVCGSVQPVAEIGALARSRGIPLLVDAAQSAGLLPVDVQAMHISLLALAGHKALYGPAGIGALYVAEDVELRPMLSGGTGGESERPFQPDSYPMHLEAGSVNTAGIAGWSAALDFLAAHGREQLLAHALRLTDRLAQRLAGVDGITLQLCPGEGRLRAPLLSLYFDRLPASEAAELLDQAGVAVRAGYHCAPAAHLTLGTFDEGTVRFSPGIFNTEEEIDIAAEAAAKLAAAR